ncbi:MFS transporter [Lactobacillus sp. ESL0228]|uniref:MFS transporter n=1 Tax=Lactobacillus sp. ESL0228 TaxID=2069352 RepID=UPI000EFBFCD4|nr:MFS transporter [Lactobacillus sp. ESL0228]RMC47424.1 MFS transporter [Lactobacillus sp. ESL0228]
MLKKKYLNVYKLLAGRVATNIADSLFYMALLWYFKETGHSPLMVALIFSIEAGIDIISFGFGPLIDRLSVKKLLKYSTLIQIMISVIIVCVLNLKQNNVIIDIFLLLLFSISTTLSSIIYPTEYKLLPLFVEKNDLLHFNGLFQISYKILDLVLDGITTFVIATTSISVTIILSAVIFAIALFTYAKVQINILAKDVLKSEEYFTGSYLKDLQIGWITLKNESNIIKLMLPLCVVNFFFGIFDIGLPYFAQSYIHDSAIGYGGLLMASSLGSILGAFVIQHFKLGKKNMAAFISFCFLGAGVFRLLVPLTVNASVVFALVNSAISSLWITMMNINFEALVQTSFSSAVLGRIDTINDSLLSLMIPLGTFVGSWIIEKFGSISTQYVYGMALLISSIYYFNVTRYRKNSK